MSRLYWNLLLRIALVAVLWAPAVSAQQFIGFVRPFDWGSYTSSVNTAYTTVYRGNYSSGAEGSGSHPGVDIVGLSSGAKLTTNTALLSIYGGQIVRKTVNGKNDYGWGNCLVIRLTGIPDTRGNGIIFVAYAHLKAFALNPITAREWQNGDSVDRGALLGFPDTTGNATGLHLHFQIDLDYKDYPVHPFWPNRTDGATDAQSEIAVPDSDGLVLSHTLNPFQFIESHLGGGSSPGAFMKALGSPGDDYASSIQRTSDGGFIVAGYTTGLGAGGQDVLLVKLDGLGGIQWARTAGTAGSDVAYSVRQTSDGGYIVSGYTDGVTGVAQLLVSKFDGSGAFQWATSLGNPSDSAAGLSVQQSTDGGYVATGFPGGALGGLGLLKYGSTGQLQWMRRAVGTNLYGNSVQQTSDGGYIVAGTKQIGVQYDLTLLKFDGLGNLQWAQLAGGSGTESGNAVQQTSDGGYIVAGSTASSGAGGQDVLLLKYDGSGTLQWARTAGGSGDEEADSVHQTSDGGYVVSGRTGSFGGGQNTLLLKYDGSGTLQWARAGGGSTSGSTVQQTADGGYLGAGSTASFGAGGSDILLIRTDANGDVTGCAGWASVSPSIGTTFPSAATSYAVDSPSFSISSPT